jgi:hypothetical protein
MPFLKAILKNGLVIHHFETGNGPRQLKSYARNIMHE